MNKVTFKKKMFLLFCYAVHEQQHEVILKDNGYQVFFFRSWGTWGTENLKETACELTKDTTIFIMGKDRNLNSLNF